MKQRKYVWLLVTAVWIGLILGLVSVSVEAKTITVGLIERGVTASNMCETIEDGDVVVLQTNGGSVSEGHALVECIRSKDVIVKVVRANSAGVFVVFGAKKVCLATRVEVGTHTPYAVWPDGSIMTLTMQQVRRSVAIWGKQLMTQGYPIEDVMYLLGMTLMTPPEEMTSIRKSTVKRILGTRYIGACEDVL